MIIGVAGRKRHGKDTIGNILTEEFGFVLRSFATPVKQIAQMVYGLTYEQVYGSEQAKETVDPHWGVSPRHILQQIGTEMGRGIHPGTWVRYAMRTTPLDENVVFTDTRFPNEARAIQARGGIIIKVMRPGMEDNDAHASETSVDEIQEDYLIVNDGTLDELRSKVKQIIVKRVRPVEIAD